MKKYKTPAIRSVQVNLKNHFLGNSWETDEPTRDNNGNIETGIDNGTIGGDDGDTGWGE